MAPLRGIQTQWERARRARFGVTPQGIVVVIKGGDGSAWVSRLASYSQTAGSPSPLSKKLVLPFANDVHMPPNCMFLYRNAFLAVRLTYRSKKGPARANTNCAMKQKT